MTRLPDRHVVRAGQVFALTCWRVSWTVPSSADGLEVALSAIEVDPAAFAGTSGSGPLDARGLSRVALAAVLRLQAAGSRSHLRWLLDAPAFSGAGVIAAPRLDAVLAERAGEAIGLIARLCAAPADDPDIPQRIAERLGRLAREISRLAPPESSVRILAAAAGRGVPVNRTVGGLAVYDLGHGNALRRLYQGFTSGVGHIATQLSTHKDLAADLMRRHGLPVPRNTVVATVGAALAWAEAEGYPVVLKPTSRDMGVGVSADVRTPEQLRVAFERARAHGRVLIEAHLPGEKYRLFVLGGRCVAAYRNVPAHVVGDGASTIRELVEAKRRRRLEDATLQGTLPDPDSDDCRAWLSRNGFTSTSVPGANQVVRLASVANAGAGGEREFLDPTDFHPDNVRMAEAAAELFGIDVAGVDFITPDPRASWTDGVGGINEINVTPALPFEPIGPWMLDHLFGPAGTGRIPVTLVIGELSASARAGLVAAAARPESGLGVCLGGEFHFGGAVDPRPRGNPSLCARLALSDRRVARAVIQLSDSACIRLGLPTPWFDACVLTVAPSGIRRLDAATGLGALLAHHGIKASRGEGALDGILRGQDAPPRA